MCLPQATTYKVYSYNQINSVNILPIFQVILAKCSINLLDLHRIKQTTLQYFTRFKKLTKFHSIKIWFCSIWLYFINFCFRIQLFWKVAANFQSRLNWFKMWKFQTCQCLPTPGKSNLRRRLSTIDLLSLTSLDHVLSILNILFTCIQNMLP